MTPQPGQQTITVYTLPNIPRSERNQTMKFGQLIEYKRIFFFRNYAENVTGRLVPDIFFFKRKKSFIQGKCNWSGA